MALKLRQAGIALLTGLLFTNSLSAFACGPFFSEAIFSYTMHPDFPLKKFVGGDIGVIRPTWAPSYLVVAYRYLNGKPLTENEKQGAQALWSYRLGFSFMDGPASEDSTEPVSAWLKLRASVPGTSKITYQDTSRLTDTESYNSFINCPNDAFKNASYKLKTLIAANGAASPLVKQWLDGQDQVFCHCGDPSYDFKANKPGAEPPFPPPLAANATAAAKADRAYQIAAAHFYARDYEKARVLFAAIANDPASAWQRTAAYMIIRCLVRQATLPDKANIALLEQAKVKLEALLQKKDMSSFQKDGAGLLKFIRFKANPEERCRELAELLAKPGGSSDWMTDLYDYTTLLDTVKSSAPEFELAKTSFKEPSAYYPDLNAWMGAVTGDEKSFPLAYAIWKERKTTAWLVACLAICPLSSPHSKELLAASESIPASSAAYPTILYQQIRLCSNKEQKKQLITKLLSLKLPPSARNLAAELKLPFCGNLVEFSRAALNSPAGISADVEGCEIPDDMDKGVNLVNYPSYPPLFFEKPTQIINTAVPLTDYRSLLTLPYNNPLLRTYVSQAVWTRAFLLQNEAVAKEAAEALQKSAPAFKNLIDAWRQAGTVAEKRFAGIFMLLKNPGMRPFIIWGVQRDTEISKLDDYQDNWWSPTEINGKAPGDDKQLASEYHKIFPAQSEIQRKTGLAEYAKIRALGPAPNFLAREVLQYAKIKPADPRIPEALHRVVRATKLGATDDQTSQFSKQAFQLLHKKYGNTTWAKQTKYFY